MLRNHNLINKLVYNQKFELSKIFYKFYRHTKNEVIKDLQSLENKVLLKEGVVKQILKIADAIRDKSKKIDFSVNDFVIFCKSIDSEIDKFDILFLFEKAVKIKKFLPRQMGDYSNSPQQRISFLQIVSAIEQLKNERKWIVSNIIQNYFARLFPSEENLSIKEISKLVSKIIVLEENEKFILMEEIKNLQEINLSLTPKKIADLVMNMIIDLPN